MRNKISKLKFPIKKKKERYFYMNKISSAKKLIDNNCLSYNIVKKKKTIRVVEHFVISIEYVKTIHLSDIIINTI